ncbi:four helix bundle protein [Robertkochia flava]|uniref:four helix bundle protein n=1 Tax=Robertkochia flava TaxID=3447986 RepID=UPI001CCB5C0F|nr:four helix bundle protein [Robertkochia marina]
MKHSDLEVWKKSIELVYKTYAITRQFPSEERYTLGNQINRAVISIPSNIAEGAGRDSFKEYIRYINIANGSLNELETQLILVNGLKLGDTSEM